MGRRCSFHHVNFVALRNESYRSKAFNTSIIAVALIMVIIEIYSTKVVNYFFNFIIISFYKVALCINIH